MPLMYLNLHECGKVFVDENGQDYVDLDEARAMAVTTARELMSHEIRGGALCLSCCIVIEDSQRTEVLRVWFREAVTLSGL